MTVSDRATELRARKQVADTSDDQRATSANGSTRPSLRLIPGIAQVAGPQPDPAEDHVPLTHAGSLGEALDGHTAASTHPPTVRAAAAAIWPSRDDVRHGFAGQVASAAAGLAQIAGLSICWGAAHVFFATKTAATISSLVLLAGLIAIAIASHA
jgi:hypothetical protein